MNRESSGCNDFSPAFDVNVGHGRARRNRPPSSMLPSRGVKAEQMQRYMDG